MVRFWGSAVFWFTCNFVLTCWTMMYIWQVIIGYTWLLMALCSKAVHSLHMPSIPLKLLSKICSQSELLVKSKTSLVSQTFSATVQLPHLKIGDVFYVTSLKFDLNAPYPPDLTFWMVLNLHYSLLYLKLPKPTIWCGGITDLKIRGMVVAVQQPLAEYTAIFSVCIV